MGSAHATFCSCWERQKLPADFPKPSATPAAPDGRGKAEEDDREVTLELRTHNTFVELREVTEGKKIKKRSRSLPRNFKPNREGVAAAASAGNAEDTAHQPSKVPSASLPELDDNVQENADEVSEVPAPQLLDHPFEPFLTYEMVSADRRWMRAVVGWMRWRDVPQRPHACAHTCSACCQLDNASWRMASCDPQRVSGQLGSCKELEILDVLAEESEEEALSEEEGSE